MAEGTSSGKGKTPMTKGAFKTAVVNAVTDAENFKEQEVAPKRLKSWSYWNGRTDLNAQPNRSKVVMTEVSDTVEQTVPQIMDLYTSGDEIVSFSCDDDLEKQTFAWQATKAVDSIFWRKNDGWCLMEDFIRDALIANTGVFKVSMRPRKLVEEYTYTGLDDDEFAMLQGDPEVEVLWLSTDEPESSSLNLPAANGEMAAGSFDARIRRVSEKPEYYVDTIAPEDFLINRSATSTVKTEYRLIGERRLMMVSDAVEMGVPFDVAEKYSGYEGADYEEQEREQRQYRNIHRHDQSTVDPATKTLVVYELYMRLDKDGDGVAELHKILAIGDRCAHIHRSEIVADHPYAVGTPIKVPHAVIGRSQADLTRDLQDINTQFMRQVLDNLSHVNNPRAEVVEQQVEMGDLLDNKFGGVIRTRAQNMVRYLEVPFVAGQTMPILDYMEERKERRTGVSKESMGLNADALQSSTETGVRAVLGMAQTQLKMIARTLCETGVKQMYLKLLNLLIQHQDTEMQIRVAGAPMKVDPRNWKNVTMDLKVNIGLGAGTREEKLAALGALGSKQQELLQAMPQSPFVTASQFGYTLHRMAQLSGAGPSEFFFKPPGPSMDQEYAKITQQMLQAQSEGQKEKSEMAKIEAKKQTDQAKIAADYQADMQKAQMDAQVDMAKAQQDMKIELLKANLMAQEKLTEAEIDAAIKSAETEMEQQLKAQELAGEFALEKYRIDQDIQNRPVNVPSVN